MSSVVTPTLPANDFPDWLSPILVKELRQGLKSRAFVSIATLLQGGMAFMFVLAALSGMKPGSGAVDALNGFFWFMLWIPLVIVMPSRALQAISDETKLQTLELVQMTRMQSLRIVFGKWIALSAQSLLLVLAILPYFVLRYFFGGVDLVAEFTSLLTLIGLSLLLTAAALAGSTLKTGLRVVAVVVVGGFILVSGQAYAFVSFGGRSFFGFSAPGDALLEGLCYALILAAYVLFFLLQAAGHLSTQAESYSPKKRVLGLVSVLVVFAAWIVHDQLGIELRLLALMTPISLWSMVEALVETRDADWLYDRPQPFWNRLFNPGWASGFYYSLVLFAIIFAGTHWGNTFSKPEHFEMLNKSFIIFVGAVLTPALILIRLPRIRQRLLLYWLIHLFFTLAFVGGLMVALKPTARESDVLALLAPFPPSTALACLHQNLDITFIRSVFPTTGFITALILCAFVFLTFKRSPALQPAAPAEPG